MDGGSLLTQFNISLVQYIHINGHVIVLYIVKLCMSLILSSLPNNKFSKAD